MHRNDVFEGHGSIRYCMFTSDLCQLNYFVIAVRWNTGATIENQKFDGESNYFTMMDVHKVHIWEITAEPTSEQVHPLHIQCVIVSFINTLWIYCNFNLY